MRSLNITDNIYNYDSLVAVLGRKDVVRAAGREYTTLLGTSSPP
jgi:hypothetical protein